MNDSSLISTSFPQWVGQTRVWMVAAIIWGLKDCKPLKQRLGFHLSRCSRHPGASILDGVDIKVLSIVTLQALLSNCVGQLSQSKAAMSTPNYITLHSLRNSTIPKKSKESLFPNSTLFSAGKSNPQHHTSNATLHFQLRIQQFPAVFCSLVIFIAHEAEWR